MRILLPFIILVSGCNQISGVKKEKISKDTVVQTAASPNFDYPHIKNKSRKLLSANPEKLPQYIADSLLPCWYGTPWDFNGCSTVPQQGKIACGYFVTTALKDAGFNINRVKMAICPSSILIKSFCSEIKTYSNKPVTDFVKEMKLKRPGLFIVGLDKHTGFIYNDGSEIYFIHSSFYSPKCVVKEKANQSAALIHTNTRMIGRIKI